MTEFNLMMTNMQAKQVLQTLNSLGSAEVRAGMKRFGITADRVHGINAPTLKALARKIGKNHDLAEQLWGTGIYEARTIAALIAEPKKVTRAQMERWVRDFDSWAICDTCCGYLFRDTPFAWDKAIAWAGRRAEYVKRAGFSLMAYLAVHDKQAQDEQFAKLLPIIERESDDDRNFVRKAINWALRQIGKRNRQLNALAIDAAQRIQARGTRSARWIAADALRELRNAAVQNRLNKKQ